MKKSIYCPVCNQKIPVYVIVKKYSITCQHCGANLIFTKKSLLKINIVSIISLTILILMLGPGKVLKLPNFVFFLLGFLLYFNVLTLLLGDLEERQFKKKIPNIIKRFCIYTAVAMIIMIGISWYLYKYYFKIPDILKLK